MSHTVCIYPKHLTWNELKAEDSVKSWQGKRWSKDTTSPKPGIQRAAWLRNTDTCSQTHIKVSESQFQRMSCPSPLAPTPHSPPPPIAQDPNLALMGACLAALLFLWLSRQTTSVPSYSSLNALYMEHGGCDHPLCQPRIKTLNVPQGCFLTCLPSTQRTCTWVEQSHRVCLCPACTLQCWKWMPRVFGCVCPAELEQMQQSRLHSPDVTG